MSREVVGVVGTGNIMPFECHRVGEPPRVQTHDAALEAVYVGGRTDAHVAVASHHMLYDDLWFLVSGAWGVPTMRFSLRFGINTPWYLQPHPIG